MPDESSCAGGEVSALRVANARLRRVVEAKDAEIAGLRAALEAGQARQAELVKRLELRVAELERRLRMDSENGVHREGQGRRGPVPEPAGAHAEDTFLNLGGMFAIVVAIVPTRRGADFHTAVQVCRKSGGTLLAHQASKNLDCPTVQALADATRTNVENNMSALLSVGGLALVLAAVMLFKDRAAKRRTKGRNWVLAGFFAAVVVWLAGPIGLAASVDWLADHAHYIAAIGLLFGILAVAGANALRLEQRRAKPSGDNPGVMDVLNSAPTNRYAAVAAAMLVVSAVLIVLWATNVITLFLTEISVAFLFVIFWSVQTVEVELEAQRSASRSGDQPGRLAPAP